jgi:hypothetical protein
MRIVGSHVHRLALSLVAHAMIDALQHEQATVRDLDDERVAIALPAIALPHEVVVAEALALAQDLARVDADRHDDV